MITYINIPSWMRKSAEEFAEKLIAQGKNVVEIEMTVDDEFNPTLTAITAITEDL